MLDSKIPILGFAAYSGTGKTTLLTRLIPILKESGLKLGAIKHSHHNFEIDYPGKDSFELRKAGASPVMVVSPYRRVVITEFMTPGDIELQDQIAVFPNENLDLILVEGFRNQSFPKIELHRPSLNKPLMFPTDADIIAIASDQPLPTPANLPCLDLNKPESLAEFILSRFLKISSA